MQSQREFPPFPQIGRATPGKPANVCRRTAQRQGTKSKEGTAYLFPLACAVVLTALDLSFRANYLTA
jgi:hypothetical protein